MSLSYKGLFMVVLLGFRSRTGRLSTGGTRQKAGKKIDKAVDKAGKAIEDQGKR